MKIGDPIRPGPDRSKIGDVKIETFDKSWFEDSKTLKNIVGKHAAGQVTIIGGSKLFHGAPLLALRGAARIAGMVYFSTPDEDKEVADKIKTGLSSFVWVPYEEAGNYIAKSDAVLIGPGMMRSHIKEQNFVCDREGEATRRRCQDLFDKHADRKWVIDGGALQVVSVEKMPRGAVVTPNDKEFEMMFGQKIEEEIEKRGEQILSLAKKYHLVILTKDKISIVSDGERVVKILGGNDGLVKGGIGDTIAGVLAGCLAKDEPIFAAAAASYLVKGAAEKLAERQGYMFNADDVVNMVPEIYGEAVNNL